MAQGFGPVSRPWYVVSAFPWLRSGRQADRDQVRLTAYAKATAVKKPDTTYESQKG